MTASPAVSAIVVNYERRSLLGDCLRSVSESLDELDGGGELIVVDNGSSDGSAELVRERFPAARLLALDDNLGFGAAVNRALEVATAPWLMLVNNDATVERTTATELLSAAGSDPRLGSVAAQLRFVARSDTINSAGMEIDRLGVAWDRLLGCPVAASEREPVEVFGVSAGGALYRRAMLEQLGGFDEGFFLFLEDVDVAWRARMAGWAALYAPAAVVHHHHSATARHGSAFKHYNVGRGRIRLLAKNATGAQLRRHGLHVLAYELCQTAFVVVAGRTLAPLRGRLAGLRAWRAARAAGAAARRPVELAPPAGLRAALRRNRAWALGSASVPGGGDPQQAFLPRM